jgi:hypothetical protein
MEEVEEAGEEEIISLMEEVCGAVLEGVVLEGCPS